MVLNKIKIGVLNICMEEYPHEVTDKLINEIKFLSKNNCEFIYMGKIFSMSESIIKTRELIKENPDLILILLGTWIDSSVAFSALKELENFPFMIWTIPMIDNSSTGSLVGFSVLKGTLERIGKKFSWVYGLPKTIFPKVIEQANYQRIKKELREYRLGLFGYASMGIYTATFDHVSVKDKLGPEVIHIDNLYLVNRMNNINEEKVKDKKDELLAKMRLEKENLDFSFSNAVKMYLSMKEIIDENKLNGVTNKCMFELSSTIGCPCLALSLLIDDGIMTTDEGDIHALITMILLNKLTNKPGYFSDLINAEENYLWFSTCGFIAPSLTKGEILIKQQAEEVGDKGVIISAEPKEGLVTIARLESIPGNRYKMHIAKGNIIEGYRRKHVKKNGLELFLFPICKVDLGYNYKKFLNNVCANHYILVWEDCTDSLTDLCEILDIEVIKDN